MDRADAAPKTTYLADYTPPSHLIDTIELTIRLDDEVTQVISRLTGRRNPESGTGPADLHLDGQQMELVALRLDGQALDPERLGVGADGLTVPALGERFVLETETRIRPQDNTALEGLYLSGGMYCTQCEAEGFRRITYFPDRPDVMAVYTVRIEADAERFPVLLSNGNRIDAGTLDGGLHFAVWHDPFPKPAYLFAMVAGDLDCDRDAFTTRSGRTVALEIYVEPGNAGRTRHAMDSLKRSMRWDEEVYGFEYDLDVFMIVAVSHFNMGAMENKGLNVFNDRFILADLDTASDIDFQRIEAIVAHEYFHNWTGNRITCRDWFQLSLKEGLTVFRDQEFSADVHDRGVKRVSDVRLLRTMQFPEDAGPTAHPVRPDSYIEINNFYTVTVYEKGAEVVRMIHTLLGAEGFRKGMDLYVQRHDGQAVTCDDFVAAMQDAGGVDLSAFKGWYSQAGTPRLTARWSRDPAAKSLSLTLSQHTPPTPGQAEKRPVPIPVRTALIGANGAPVTLSVDGRDAGDETVLVLDEAHRSFTFTDVPEDAVPSLLRGFSAPVTLDADWSDDDLGFLAARDNDTFARWEALQTLSIRSLLTMVGGYEKGERPALQQPVLKAYRSALVDPGLQPAFLAELLTLPGESILGQALEVWPVDAVHAAREGAARAIGDDLYDLWNSVYEQASERVDPGDLSTEAMGLRALRNRALGYLVASRRPAALDRAAAQAAAASMTDVMGALVALNDVDAEQRTDCLKAFHDRWQDNPLVLDKWFALEAMSSLPTTLSRVEALLGHPRFDMKNPNRVRSVLSVFASLNPVRFHAADGSGYTFVADQVLALDQLNPQVAARLVQLFVRWRNFDDDRQAAMTDALRRIVQQPNLSKDVYEIASKALA